jgi:DNA modification methylase
MLMNDEFQFKQMIVWDKGKMGMGWHYRRSYETILVASMPGGKCRWYDRTRRVENVIRPGDYDIRKIIPGPDQHPTEKPVSLAAHFIDLHTRIDHVVLDPFMGTGSTCVAAFQAGRQFIGIELDPVFYRQAKRRIQTLVSRLSWMASGGRMCPAEN